MHRALFSPFTLPFLAPSTPPPADRSPSAARGSKGLRIRTASGLSGSKGDLAEEADSGEGRPVSWRERYLTLERQYQELERENEFLQERVARILADRPL